MRHESDEKEERGIQDNLQLREVVYVCSITWFHHTKNVRKKNLNKNSWISTRCIAPKQSYATLASIT